MFIYDLPYCGDKFSVKPYLFKNHLDVARLIYEDNDEGISNYLVDFFDIRKLNILDKFFVIVKAVELFIDEKISLNIQQGELNIPIKIILDELYQDKEYRKTYTVDNFTIVLDLPVHLSHKPTGDVFISTIQSISIDDTVIDFTDLSEDDKTRILSLLPTRIFNILREYTESIQLNIEFLNEITSKKNINKIAINFLSNDPFLFVKNLLSKYQLYSCREILYHLSKKIESNIIYNSTLSDIDFFITESSKDRDNQDGNMMIH